MVLRRRSSLAFRSDTCERKSGAYDGDRGGRDDGVSFAVGCHGVLLFGGFFTTPSRRPAQAPAS